MSRERTLRVAIIGAGMSGICMAVKLQDAGIDDFVVYESADDVGGTWRDNTYPGLSCDVPSRFYSYSFRLNPEWSRFMSPGPEIHRYFRQVADERGVTPRIRFGAEVTAARFEDKRWWVSTSDGEEAFDVLITATGVLRVPRYPEIEGLDTFAGRTFHSSRWDHSISLHNKRIGLIGTGSTGVQITAELGGNVRGLTIFQRSAQWVYPTPNLRYRAMTKAALARWPVLNNLGYRFWQTYIENTLGRAAVEAGLNRRVMALMCRLNLQLSVRDSAMRRKLTPDYHAMCKRLILAGHYYRSIQKPGVHLVTEAIDHVEPRGVVTSDGVLHELDLLVLATGFDARAYVRPMGIVNDNGVTLDEVWEDGPHAYRSIAVPGFPNLFMLMGPHSPIGNQSLVLIAENQADYAMWWINKIRNGDIIAASPTDAATKDYNEQMKSAMPQTIWMTGCNSWYLGKDGLPELFPWRPARHRELLATPDVSHFDVRTA